MGIVWNPRGLIAEIALRFRVGTVAAHLGDAVILDQDFDAAIDVAEIAGGLSPFTGRHRRAPVRIALSGILHDDRHRNNRRVAGVTAK